MNVSFIIPTRNNLPYLKLAYSSIRNYYPNQEIVILDDQSTDGTQEWAWALKKTDTHLKFHINKGRQLGHTVLYDKGVELSSNEVFTIFHADMVCGPNYLENLFKHLKPQGVVSATRIEPPLHPPGNEKIVKDFGTYAEDIKLDDLRIYCETLQQETSNKNITTRGIFAPWMMYKKDFLAVGGHDKFFAPFPYEDSDIFQRFILKGYDIKQSRDAFVYHFTCRGHRWTEKVQKDDHFYKICCAKNSLHFIRKWGSWIKNDEFSYPIIPHLYDIGFVITNCPSQLLGIMEPWSSNVYCDANREEYINFIQPGTPFDLSKRVRSLSDPKTNQIIVSFDGNHFADRHMKMITDLSQILTESGDIGTMEYDIFKFEISGLKTFENQYVENDSFYQNKLRKTPESDPYVMDELFNIFHQSRPESV